MEQILIQVEIDYKYKGKIINFFRISNLGGIILQIRLIVITKVINK